MIWWVFAGGVCAGVFVTVVLLRLLYLPWATVMIGVESLRMLAEDPVTRNQTVVQVYDAVKRS